MGFRGLGGLSALARAMLFPSAMMSPSLKDLVKAFSILAALVVGVACLDAWLASRDTGAGPSSGAAFLSGATAMHSKG